MYKVKRFSIQSGKPSKPGSLSRELGAKSLLGAGLGSIGGGLMGTAAGIEVGVREGAKQGLLVGGAVLAGFAAFGAIAGALSAMGAKKARSKATKVNMNQVLDQLDVTTRSYEKNADIVDINIFRYIDTDMDPANYHLTIAYEDGCAVLVIKNPKADLLSELNDNLEDMVKYNRKADYVSEPTDDGYVVYVTIPSVDSMIGLIYNVVKECRIKINCLTEKKIQL